MGRTSFQKRQKEMKRQEKQQKKVERRVQRKLAKNKSKGAIETQAGASSDQDQLQRSLGPAFSKN